MTKKPTWEEVSKSAKAFVNTYVDTEEGYVKFTDYIIKLCTQWIANPPKDVENKEMFEKNVQTVLEVFMEIKDNEKI
jgi:hypothetical protein